jgi:3-isopropylmalate/(R)-2-methylmalate dehydratase small subunit
MINATVRKYGDAIDTDVIIPAQYLTSRDRAFLGSKCMEGVDPNFAKRINPGDVLVAGRNFGCGSSREHAVIALQGAGISCVIAASYARIFYRNAINQGFPIVVCPEAAAAAREGDSISVDLNSGRIDINGKVFTAQPFPEFLQQIIKCGGLVPFVKQRMAANKAKAEA